MIFDYYNLPFGAQLLLWTSRIAFHGSCRTKPNKYDLINIAYKKVGIENGSILLKEFLFPLRNSKAFKLQPICNRALIEDEINLINCIQEHKKTKIDNNYYIELWGLHNNKKLFTSKSINLANAFKKINLDTDLKFYEHARENFDTQYSFSKTLH